MDVDVRAHKSADPPPNPKSLMMGSPRFYALFRMLQKAQLFAAKGLSYHLTYASWRIRRLTGRLQSEPVVSGLELATKLALELPELVQVRTGYAQKCEKAVNLALREHFRTRNAPRFLFDDSDLDEIVALVGTMDRENRDRTIHTADQICQNRFRFRRAPTVVFDGVVDWEHCPDGNTDWTWDLNRHAYFETLGRAYGYTGDGQYSAKFRSLLLEWLIRNPASVGQPSWSSVFEVGFRVNTWIWALFLFQRAPLDEDTHAALLAGLWIHGHFLDTHLELHAENNHLLLEAKSLAMLGILFPEFRAASRWRERGLAIFYQELRAQVCADGVHGERASLYHRIISGELLELSVLTDNNGIALPPDIAKILTNMIEFELWHTKPDGQVSLFGDSSTEDVHLRFSGVSGGVAFTQSHRLKAVAPGLGEKELWLLGPQRVKKYLSATTVPTEPGDLTQLGSRAFADGGYFIMRSGSGPERFYALFDCGPFGYKLDAIHGHADALSVELYAHGQTWLVDPGVYSTHMGLNWRHFFRGTRSHNTVVVDDQDQSRLLDGRRVYRPAKASLHQWFSNDTFDFVAGSHDGYERLAEPISHHRQIFFAKSQYWVVVDQLTGEGDHSFDLYFHLLPGLKVQRDPCSLAVCIENEHGASMQIVPVNDKLSKLEIIEGATEPVQGWVALYSGEKLSAPVLRYRRQVAAPTTFCTLLYPRSPTAPSGSVKATQSPVTAKAAISDLTRLGASLTALTIDTGDHLDCLLIAPGTSGVGKVFGNHETDAELLYMRQQKANGDPITLEMHNGTWLGYQSRSLSAYANNLRKSEVLRV